MRTENSRPDKFQCVCIAKDAGLGMVDVHSLNFLTLFRHISNTCKILVHRPFNPYSAATAAFFGSLNPASRSASRALAFSTFAIFT